MSSSGQAVQASIELKRVSANEVAGPIFGRSVSTLVFEQTTFDGLTSPPDAAHEWQAGSLGRTSSLMVAGPLDGLVGLKSIPLAKKPKQVILLSDIK